jgi:hypothetical protein
LSQSRGANSTKLAREARNPEARKKKQNCETAKLRASNS